MVDIMENKLRVWWIPQVGAISEAFYVPVQSVEEGKKVLDMLAAYDAFQLQNRIKPDYSNAGGLQIYNPEIADYEDWYLETDDDYFDDVDDYCEQCEKAEELTEFNQALFEQIDWEKIERMTRQEVDVMKEKYKIVAISELADMLNKKKFGESIDFTFDRSTYKTNPSRFNVQAILGLDKLNIMQWTDYRWIYSYEYIHLFIYLTFLFFDYK